MSALEVAEWARFSEEFGPLTVHERLDAIGQQIAYVIHATAGGKQPPETFAIRWKLPHRWTDEQVWMWLGAEAGRN